MFVITEFSAINYTVDNACVMHITYKLIVWMVHYMYNIIQIMDNYYVYYYVHVVYYGCKLYVCVSLTVEFVSLTDSDMLI